MFSAEEMINIAVRIEENGFRFYRQAAEAAPDNEARLLFNFLADQETAHQEIFASLRAEADSASRLMENYPGEHRDYLTAYADGLIFGRELKKDQLPAMTDAGSSIAFAIKRELESILYYQEIRVFFQGPGQVLLDRIIAEERSHFTRLSALQKSYT